MARARSAGRGRRGRGGDRESGTDLPNVLADVASHTPDLMAAFGATGRKMLWANDSLRRELGVPAWASPPLIELLDDSSQGQFVVRVLPSLLSAGGGRAT